MALYVSLAFFGLFVLNVALGASGGNHFAGDIGEALILACAVIAFVVGILKAEAVEAEKSKK